MVTVRPVCGRAASAALIGSARAAGTLVGWVVRPVPGAVLVLHAAKAAPVPAARVAARKVRRVRFSDALIADLTFLDETVPPLFAPESLTGRDVETGDHP